MIILHRKHNFPNVNLYSTNVMQYPNFVYIDISLSSNARIASNDNFRMTHGKEKGLQVVIFKAIK